MRIGNRLHFGILPWNRAADNPSLRAITEESEGFSAISVKCYKLPRFLNFPNQSPVERI